jgi:hypothetical protein
MTQQPWHDDQSLLEDLAEALGPVSSQVERIADQARGAFAWRTVDDDLLFASLSFDSQQLAAPTRSAATSRMVSFSAAPLAVEIEITPSQIIGQLSPPSQAQILVEAADGAIVRVDADEFGFFEVRDLPTGPVRLRCDTPTGRVVTDWVRL